MMNCVCSQHKRVSPQTLSGYDPTRTTGLRNSFASNMGRRFRKTRGLIRQAIVTQDCFGLRPPRGLTLQAASLPGQKAFAFERSGDKVAGFMEWLRNQVEIEILEHVGRIGTGIESAWTNTYITTAYQQGIRRARQELRKAGATGPDGELIPTFETDDQLSAAFNQPFHADRVGLLYTRTFSDLKGITDTMDSQISRILAQGIADGRNPNYLAKLLTTTISGPMGDLGITDTLGRFIPAERRAKILARTEIIRAHHVATVQEYRNWKLVDVQVQAEWQTAGDGRVCPICASMNGNIYTLDQIESMIPRHPQCRCIALPYLPEKKKPSTSPAPKKPSTSPTLPPFHEDMIKWDTFFDPKKIAEQMKDRFNVKAMPYLTSPRFKEDRIAKANIIGDCFASEIFGPFPKLRKRAGKILQKGQLKKLILESTDTPKGSASSGVLANYWPTKSEIRMGRNSMTRTSPSLTLGGGKHNVGLDFRTVFRHEYGHHIYYKFLTPTQRREWDSFAHTAKGVFKDMVSRYSSINVRESFAEAFAAYTSPLYDMTGAYASAYRLPESIEKMMIKFFGEPKR